MERQTDVNMKRLWELVRKGDQFRLKVEGDRIILEKSD